MKGKPMTEDQAIRYIREAFNARVLPKLELVSIRRRNLNAELYSAMDDDGVFDEPWWLDYEE
jgi:hypothetical protein